MHVDILNGDDEPSQVIIVMDVLEPGSPGGEAGYAVKVVFFL